MKKSLVAFLTTILLSFSISIPTMADNIVPQNVTYDTAILLKSNMKKAVASLTIYHSASIPTSYSEGTYGSASAYVTIVLQGKKDSETEWSDIDSKFFQSSSTVGTHETFEHELSSYDFEHYDRIRFIKRNQYIGTISYRSNSASASINYDTPYVTIQRTHDENYLEYSITGGADMVDYLGDPYHVRYHITQHETRALTEFFDVARVESIEYNLEHLRGPYSSTPETDPNYYAGSMYLESSSGQKIRVAYSPFSSAQNTGINYSGSFNPKDVGATSGRWRIGIYTFMSQNNDTYIIEPKITLTQNPYFSGAGSLPETKSNRNLLTYF